MYTHKSDIKKIKGKYYDFNPRNKSFLQTATELKNLGIKNYYFMLEIKNPAIADIDPFAEPLPQNVIQALMIELRTNIWYYARCVARIRSDFGIVDFELHRGLAAAIWAFDKRFDWCLCEPRQTYKTSGTIATIVAWAFQIATENANIHFFGKETDNTKRNLAMLKDDIELLPKWLQFSQYYDESGKVKKARRSTEILVNGQFHNRIHIHPKPTSKSHAQGMARGASAAMLYCDEIEHTPHFGILLANSAPAFKTAADNARRAGKPYGRMMTTTPGDLDTVEGLEVLPIIKSMIPWSEKLYDMTDEQIEEYKRAWSEEYHSDPNKKGDREVIDIFYMEYHYWQVRKSHEWVNEQFKLSGDKMAIRREILLQRLRGSSNSPIDQDDLETMIQNMVKSEKELIIHDKWLFKVYDHSSMKMVAGRIQDFDDSIPYLIGVDPAAGGGGDYTAITIVNPYTLEIAAEFRNKYISGTDLCRLLVDLINEYIPRAVLIPEKNSMGIYLIQMLYETSVRENMYWSESARQLENITEENEDDLKLRTLSEQYKKYGTYLTKKVRDAMLELLYKHVNEAIHLLNTEYLVDDICKLTITSTKRVEAVKGEHDDSLFSYLHCLYIYYTGDNLALFGIDPKAHPVMSPVEVDTEGVLQSRDPMSSFFSAEQVTWEKIVQDDCSRIEEQIKYLVSTDPTIYDEVYSNVKSDPMKDNNVNISPHFFDMVNGLVE